MVRGTLATIRPHMASFFTEDPTKDAVGTRSRMKKGAGSRSDGNRLEDRVGYDELWLGIESVWLFDSIFRHMRVKASSEVSLTPS